MIAVTRLSILTPSRCACLVKRFVRHHTILPVAGRTVATAVFTTEPTLDRWHSGFRDSFQPRPTIIVPVEAEDRMYLVPLHDRNMKRVPCTLLFSTGYDGGGSQRVLTFNWENLIDHA